MNLLSSCLSLSTKVQVCIPRPGCLSLFLFVQLKSCGKREVLFSELWCLQSLTPGKGWDLPLLGLSQPTLPCPCFQTHVEGFVADSGLGTDGVLVLLDVTQRLPPVSSTLYQQEYREQVPGPLYCLSWQAGSLAGMVPSSFPRAAS